MMGTIYDFSKKDEWHTQLNNKKLPMASCNVTAYVMAAKQAGCLFQYDPGMQPEDYFLVKLNEREVVEYVKDTMPWAVGDGGQLLYPPQEIHQCLAYVFNKLCKTGSARFSMFGRLPTLCKKVGSGHGVVLSGKFTHRVYGVINHIVSLAGFRIDDLGHIDALIIDDPLGDFRTKYDNHNGNSIPMLYQEAVRMLKTPGDTNHKWAHTISKK